MMLDEAERETLQRRLAEAKTTFVRAAQASGVRTSAQRQLKLFGLLLDVMEEATPTLVAPRSRIEVEHEELLGVVERVAELSMIIVEGEPLRELCPCCRAWRELGGSTPGVHPHAIPHAPDCVWVHARMIASAS